LWWHLCMYDCVRICKCLIMLGGFVAKLTLAGTYYAVIIIPRQSSRDFCLAAEMEVMEVALRGWFSFSIRLG